MALRNLSTQSMIELSAAWLDPKRDRKRLAKLPLAAALLPTIEAAHAALLTLQARGPAKEQAARVKTLQEREAMTDLLHDRKGRGTWQILTGLAELDDDDDERQRLLDLRDRLLPEGLDFSQRSFRDEAGAARLLEVRYDSATRNEVAAIAVKVRTKEIKLAAQIDALIAAGKALGEMEAQKATLQRQAAEGAEGVTPSAIARARNGWVRAANALVANLDLAADLDDAERAALLGALLEAEARADRRTARKSDRRDAPQPPLSPNRAPTNPNRDALPLPCRPDRGASGTPSLAARGNTPTPKGGRP